MASLQFNIPDAALARVMAAYGAISANDLKDKLAAQVKKYVVEYEVGQADGIESAKVQQAETNKKLALANAKQSANTEIVIS